MPSNHSDKYEQNKELKKTVGKYIEIRDKNTCEFIKCGKIINTRFEYSHHCPVKIFQIEIK